LGKRKRERISAEVERGSVTTKKVNHGRRIMNPSLVLSTRSQGIPNANKGTQKKEKKVSEKKLPREPIYQKPPAA